MCQLWKNNNKQTNKQNNPHHWKLFRSQDRTIMQNQTSFKYLRFPHPDAALKS